MPKPKRSKLTISTKEISRYITVLVIVIAVGGLGTAFLVTSHAATPVNSVEPEAGSVSAAATKITDSTASGSQAVKFGSGTTTGGGTGTGTYPSNYPQNCGVDGEVAGDTHISKPVAGYPNVCTTGWIHTGVTLTTHAGDLIAATPNMTIDSTLVTGDIYVQAANVHITRSWAQNRIFIQSGNAIVSDTEIGPPNHNARVANDVGHGGIGTANYSCIRCYIHTHSDLSWINGNVDMEDSLLINPFILIPPAVSEANADHADGAQASGGNGNVTMRHNYIDVNAVNVNDVGNTDVLWADGSDGTVTLDDNVFVGGQWSLSLHENGHFVVTNNKIVNNSWADGPVYDTLGVFNTCTGNTLIDATGNQVGTFGC
jgi:hypothetical protein